MHSTSKWFYLAGFIVVCQLVGGLGAFATLPEIDGWYRSLQQPSWTPPNWVFGPVWTILYLLMAIAAWWVWLPHGWRGAKAPLAWFAVQLVLNGAWSWIFFAGHQIGWGLLDIVLLWCAILITTILFFRRSQLAGSLLIPYLAWVTYATTLNFALWQMN